MVFSILSIEHEPVILGSLDYDVPPDHSGFLDVFLSGARKYSFFRLQYKNVIYTSQRLTRQTRRNNYTIQYRHCSAVKVGFIQYFLKVEVSGTSCLYAVILPLKLGSDTLRSTSLEMFSVSLDHIREYNVRRYGIFNGLLKG